MMKRLGSAAAVLAFAAWMAAPATAQVIDHPTTFTGQTDLTFNNNASVTAGGNAQLTPATGNNLGSFWTTVQLPVDKFTARFSLHTLGTPGELADGMGFCLQRVGPTAIGAIGGGMGYSGMLTSLYIKFDNYDNESSTGMYQNGANPGVNSITMRPNVDLHSLDDFRVDMTYNGTTIAMTVTDLLTTATFSTTFTVDIPTVIGGATAHVGFTGATGGKFANQEVLNLVYVTAPTGLTPTNNINQVVLNWTPVTGAATYNVYRGTTQIATGLTNPTHTDNGVSWPNTATYVVRAVVSGVEGPDSNQATGVPLPPAITATPNTGLQTNENGATALFNLRLNQNLLAANSITVTIQSNNAGEGQVSGNGEPPAPATFAPLISFTLNGPLTAPYTVPITVTGIDDSSVDPATPYTVSVSATSTQGVFNGISIPDIQLTNGDNDTAGITLSRTSGLVTAEGGGTDTFTVSLTTQPSAPVTMSLTSSNTLEGTVSTNQLIFASTPGGANGWNVQQVVTLTGADDAILDFTIPYTIVTGALASADPNYDTMPVPDVSAVNLDNEAVPALKPVWGGGGSGGGCGLTGLELGLVALLAVVRRRRRGR